MIKVNSTFLGVFALIGSAILLTNSYLELLDQQDSVMELRESIRKAKVTISLQSRQQQPKTKKDITPVIVEETSLDLTLMGAVLAPDVELALVQTQNGDIHRLRINDQIGDAKLIKITPREVVFSNKDQLTSLKLPEGLYEKSQPTVNTTGQQRFYSRNDSQTRPSLAEISSNPFFNTPFKGM